MDVAILVLTAAVGLFSGPWYSALIAGLVLTLLSAGRKFELARLHPSPAGYTVLIEVLLLSFMNNTVFTTISFGLGRAIAWLNTI